jgi:hypothetical protein
MEVVVEVRLEPHSFDLDHWVDWVVVVLAVIFTQFWSTLQQRMQQILPMSMSLVYLETPALVEAAVV